MRMIRQLPWALVATLVIGVPLVSAPVAGQPAARAQVPAPVSVPHLFEAAYSRAIAVQAAIARRDWAGARLALSGLRQRLAVLEARPNLRDELSEVRTDVEGTGRSLDAGDAKGAGDAAYRVVVAFVEASNQLVSTGGGGGGVAPAVPMPVAQTALEHLEAAYQDAGRAQLGLAQRDTAAARIYLQGAALRLDEAAMASPAPALRRAIAGLRLSADRTAAALQEPARAQQLGQSLIRGFASALQAATPTGGGGGPLGAPDAAAGASAPPGGTAGDVDRAGRAGQGDQGNQPGAGDKGPAFDDIDQDRPNQRGRQ
jgi:hypothetical protein